ncbi:MAG: hypothetical protein AAF497_18420 [Planctomycetota bacterium]
MSQANSEVVASTKAPIWYWIVSLLALAWNLLGLMAFYFQVTLNDESMATLDPAQQELYKSMPGWVNIAFGTAVIGGSLGCLLLLFRSRWATPVLLLSLLGVLAQNAYMFFLSNTFEIMGSGAMLMPIVIIVISVTLFLLACLAGLSGWLK